MSVKIMRQDYEQAAENFQKLLPKHKCELALFHNQHKSCYETVDDYTREHQDDFVSQKQKKKAIETNELWELIVYPDTPIGNYRLYACDLWALLEGAEDGSINDYDLKGIDNGS